MKESDLRQIIKEEVRRVLYENSFDRQKDVENIVSQFIEEDSGEYFYVRNNGKDIEVGQSGLNKNPSERLKKEMKTIWSELEENLINELEQNGYYGWEEILFGYGGFRIRQE